MIVEELITRLGLEVDNDISGKIRSFASALTSGYAGIATAAAAVFSGFVGVVGSAAHAADEIGDMAEKLGVNAQALQELTYAAKLSDVSFEALSTGLKFVAKNAVDAADKGGEAAQAFAGIDLHDANGNLKTADQLLEDVAGKFENIKDPIRQTNVAMKIFGRSGQDLVPMLRKGRAGIADLRKEALAMGVVFDQDAVKAANELDDSLKRVTTAATGLRNKFAAPFFKAFADILEKKVLPFLLSLQPGIEKLAKTFTGAFTRLISLGRTVFGVFERFAGIFEGSWLSQILKGVDAFKLLEGVIVGLGVVGVATALSFFASWALAALPILGLALAIGLVVDELNSFANGNESVLGAFIQWLNDTSKPTSLLVESFKSLAALIFDVANPAAWDRIVANINKIIEPVEQLASIIGALLGIPLGGIVNVAKSSVVGQVTSLRDLTNPASAFNPIDLVSAASQASNLAQNPFATIGPTSSASGVSNSSNVVTNNVTINAQGVSAEQVMSIAKQEINASYAESLPAVSSQ